MSAWVEWIKPWKQIEFIWIKNKAHPTWSTRPQRTSWSSCTIHWKSNSLSTVSPRGTDNENNLLLTRRLYHFTHASCMIQSHQLVQDDWKWFYTQSTQTDDVTQWQDNDDTQMPSVCEHESHDSQWNVRVGAGVSGTGRWPWNTSPQHRNVQQLKLQQTSKKYLHDFDFESDKQV